MDCNISPHSWHCTIYVATLGIVQLASCTLGESVLIKLNIGQSAIPARLSNINHLVWVSLWHDIMTQQV